MIESILNLRKFKSCEACKQLDFQISIKDKFVVKTCVPLWGRP